jgi:hypothetical protein
VKYLRLATGIAFLLWLMAFIVLPPLGRAAYQFVYPSADQTVITDQLIFQGLGK